MSTIWLAFRDELLSVARNPGALLVLLGAIVLYALFYPVPYSPQVLKEVPVIVADLDRSELSRTLVRMAEANELLRIEGRATSLAEAEQQMISRQAGGILLIPSGFEQTVLRGEQAYVAAYADASYLLVYRQVLTGLLTASGTLSAGVEIQRMVARGIPAEVAMVSRAPITFSSRPLFNAVEGYSTFVVPSVLLLILQQTVLIGTGLVEGSRREFGAASQAIGFRTVPLIVLGRACFYLLVYWLNAWFYLGPLSRWYGFPSEGNSLVVFFFTQPFLLSAIFLGLAGAAAFRHRQRSMQVFAVTSLPMLLVAGVVWPTELIPSWIRSISHAIPSTPAIAGFLRINMMGANLDEVAPEYLHLWLLTAAYFPLACLSQWLANRKPQTTAQPPKPTPARQQQPQSLLAPSQQLADPYGRHTPSFDRVGDFSADSSQSAIQSVRPVPTASSGELSTMRTPLKVKLYRSELPIVDQEAASSVQEAAEAGGGVLRCFPSFVGRKFCLPGKNLELVDEDYFPEGRDGWAIDERWNGSAILADTGNGIHGEGLCHFHHPDGYLIPMDAAVHSAPDFMVGPMYRTLNGTGFYNKEFDNLYPLGHHMHPFKPEAYNFNAWRNKRYRNDCHTSVGLMEYFTEEMLAESIRDFIAGRNNHIRSHARNLAVRMGTGFLTPTRILHGPAAVNTEEPQRDRDDFRFYQSHVLAPEGEVFLGPELLFRHLPEGLEGEDRVQRLVNDINMPANKDPFIVEKHLLLPVVDEEASQGGFRDEWRVYGRPNGDELFSLRQFELAPGAETILTGPASLCILHFCHGTGKIGSLHVEVKSGIRLGEELHDEFVIPYAAQKAQGGVKLVNTSQTEPLVGTRCWGPEAWGHKMPKAPFETWPR